MTIHRAVRAVPTCVVLAGLLLPLVSPAALAAPRDVARASAEATDDVFREVDVSLPADAGGAAGSPEVLPSGTAEVVADETSADGRRVADAVAADGVQTVGVTWPEGVDGAALSPQVRTRADGVWSSWTDMPVADESPDPGTADAAQVLRDGTDSVWVGDVDAVQVSFAPTAVAQDVVLSLVGSPEPRVAETAPTGGGFSGVRADTQIAGIRVYTRAEWGAAPQTCAPDVASQLVGAVVHHTAGTNAYGSVAEAMQQIRNDQKYHMQGRGWCDLGYNAVVDKWGNIYEGRANSLVQPVIGVHAGGFNTGTFGISMLGTYDAPPSAETTRAVGTLIGRRLALYGVDPQGTMQYTTGAGENSRFKNQTVTLPRVIGHRDVAYTACPGAGGYAALPAVRAIAASASVSQAQLTSDLAYVRAVYQDLLGRAPDTQGLYAWAATLVLGASRSAVGASIASSPEYVDTKVRAAYRDLLGRQPDPAGTKTWTQEIASGRLRLEDLRGVLIASDEYFVRAGGTDRAYVDRLYQDILGRVPSAGEVDYWLGLVARAGRGVAPRGVWWSLESGYRRVGESYSLLLARSADPQGATLWAHYWLGNGESAMRSGILESEEYSIRARARFA